MTVLITRQEHDAAALRHWAGRSSDARLTRRLLAVALILDGAGRTDAAAACGMDRQTLRDWVHRYNVEGVAGLSDRAHGGGVAARLTPAQEAEIAGWVRAGPDAEGLVRWRCVDLRARIAERFEVSLHERSVGKLLRRLGFSRVSVRPRHPKTDLAAQAAHKKTSPTWSPPPCPPQPGASRSRCGGRTKPGSASKAA